METTERLEVALRGHGYRSTAPRRAVWQVLVRSGDHLTVERVHELAREAGANLDLASAYRALGLLAELGLARETRLGDGAGRWELAHPDEHFHLVCTECGDVDHHVGSLVADLTDHLAEEPHRFAADRVELTVTGRCARCRPGTATGA